MTGGQLADLAAAMVAAALWCAAREGPVYPPAPPGDPRPGNPPPDPKPTSPQDPDQRMTAARLANCEDSRDRAA